jgi:hypothetical protein
MLRLPDTPGSSFLLKYRQRKERHAGRKSKQISPTKRHFFTLTPTLEDAQIPVKENDKMKQWFFSMKSRT